MTPHWLIIQNDTIDASCFSRFIRVKAVIIGFPKGDLASRRDWEYETPDEAERAYKFIQKSLLAINPQATQP